MWRESDKWQTVINELEITIDNIVCPSVCSRGRVGELWEFLFSSSWEPSDRWSEGITFKCD